MNKNPIEDLFERKKTVIDYIVKGFLVPVSYEGFKKYHETDLKNVENIEKLREEVRRQHKIYSNKVKLLEDIAFDLVKLKLIARLMDESDDKAPAMFLHISLDKPFKEIKKLYNIIIEAMKNDKKEDWNDEIILCSYAFERAKQIKKINMEC
jgi:hypothetical protein